MNILQKIGSIIESNLLPLVILTTILGLGFPQLGEPLSSGITPLLALLMFLISLTFDTQDIRQVLTRPSHQLLATFLVYIPMSLMGLLTGRLFFGTSLLATGQILVGTLPTDVSAPLLVLLARGNVALAAVLNAVNTVLAPLIVPVLFLILTGIELQVPLGMVILELSFVVVLPTLLGVSLRTYYPISISRFDWFYSVGGSVVYLMLLLGVLSPNAETILNYGWYALWIALATLTLNLSGYAIANTVRFFIKDRQELIAYLFTVSKKEFSIAAAFVTASGLPIEIVIPSIFFAVIQMITSPIAVKILTRSEPPH